MTYKQACRALARLFLDTAGVLILAAALLTGCGSSYERISPPFGARLELDNESALNTHSAQSELESAARQIRAGEYAQAILRLQRVIGKYDGTPPATDARYWLARTYEEIQGLEKARDYYAEYLSIAPDGAYAAYSQERLDYLNGKPGTVLEFGPEAERIAQLREEIKVHPNEPAYPLELADVLWVNGRYTESGEVYANLLQEWPGLASDMTIRNRISFNQDGTYTLLTPAEVVRQDREADPLRIINSRSYRSGMFSGNNLVVWNAQDRFYNVTGEALNVSESNLNNVHVQVTIEGVADQIFDTTTVNIGTLRPGERRPFSVRFQNFDNIENVRGFECVGTYSR